MSKQTGYLRHFPRVADAERAARTKNAANRMPGWLFVVVDGPEDGATVMDLPSAIAGEFLYRWAA